ncbi:MAG: SsrA-binding protein SmpB [Chitinivibrionales bacterium]|nr:SsrA-binding protein SmpB [Chitinivibrionales bacterium]
MATDNRTLKKIAQNKKAYHDYEILEKFETGIALRGTEVKSIRAGHVSLSDSFAFFKNGEIFIHHFHISPFEFANRFNHDPYRNRKLLLHKRQIQQVILQVERKGLTLIPLSVYFKNEWVKVELGLCKGLKKYDKRDKIASEETKKRLARIMKDPRLRR